MTIKEAEKRLEAIRAIGWRDPEVGHGEEDELREDVLLHIANGGRNARRLAEIALKTKDLDFPRWYA